MGKKRKREKTEEEIRQKIRKLEAQLVATNSNENVKLQEELDQMPLEIESYCESPLWDTYQHEEVVEHATSLHQLSPLPLTPRLLSPRETSPSRSPSKPDPPPSQPGTSNKIQIAADESELEADILELLGDAPKSDISLGPPIHKDVAQRWQDILKNGLTKDLKANLLKEYLVPNNCDLLMAPALNPEVKAALPDVLIKRDQSLAYKQKQLGLALSALSKVTEMVISNEISKQKLLKPLSDACRILCDSHHTETKTRRGFVISSINAKLKDALIESGRDKLLFGENVSEKLKAVKSIQQSGEALKNATKPKYRPTLASTSLRSTANRGRLNFMRQHRKTDNKPTDGWRVANLAYRQQQSSSSNSAVHRPSERPLPVRHRK